MYMYSSCSYVKLFFVVPITCSATIQYSISCYPVIMSCPVPCSFVTSLLLWRFLLFSCLVLLPCQVVLSRCHTIFFVPNIYVLFFCHVLFFCQLVPTVYLSISLSCPVFLSHVLCSYVSSITMSCPVFLCHSCVPMPCSVFLCIFCYYICHALCSFVMLVFCSYVVFCFLLCSVPMSCSVYMTCSVTISCFVVSLVTTLFPRHVLKIYHAMFCTGVQFFSRIITELNWSGLRNTQ